MIRTIGVIGAGQMGNGIAHVAALHGYNVKLVDVDVYQIDQAKETIDQNMGRQVKRQLIADKEKTVAPVAVHDPPSTSLLTFDESFYRLAPSEVVCKQTT